MFEQLAEAVYAGDLVKAEGVLELMHASGQRSDMLRRAKYRARPDSRPRAPELREPLVLPVPGTRPGDTLGGRQTLPRLEKKRRRG